MHNKLSRTDLPDLERRLEHTSRRLAWHLEGLGEAPPGYRGYIFAARGQRRQDEEQRIAQELARLRAMPVPPDKRKEVAHTVARLAWYLEGLKESPEGYRGRLFATDEKRRKALSKRVRHELGDIAKMRRRVAH